MRRTPESVRGLGWWSPTRWERTLTLRVKLFVLIAGVIIFAAIGVTAVALWRDVIRGQQLLAREGHAVASSAALAAAHWLRADGNVDPGGEKALQAVTERALRALPLERAWVVDRTGRVLACSDEGRLGCPPGLPPDDELQPDAWPRDTVDRLIVPEGLIASAPVVRDGETVGAVRVAFHREEVEGSARDLAWGAAVVAAVWIALSHLFAALFIRRVTRPLVQVVRASERLRAEARGVRIEEPDDPELRDLAHAFNEMAERLDERRAENERLISGLEERVAEKTREVLRADRLATLGGIAAGFAHEIGNALNVIRGYTGVILRELPEDHPNRPDADAVRREVQRAAGLIERFLVFARARTVHPHAQPVEPILRDAVEVIGPSAAQAHVVREIEIAPGLPDVVADAELLRQAFLNLGVNAVQAMASRGGGRLRVRARADGTAVVVEFQDDGPGMDPSTAAHVFEPFFTTKATGTGLGLSIVRQAAEAHGGSVEVESAPNVGATFRVRLPAAPASAASPEDASGIGGAA
ncbi:MAG TPA: ATP-binding protein [Anaeromyxobacteraceae bacterium]|nr:ATP-binding protein [Anaeromyxobacteraceae bacterium]